jgi:membrane protein
MVTILSRFYDKVTGLLTNFMKNSKLPGFDGLSMHDVAVFFIQGIRKGGITTRASAIAFNFFLALFPAIIFFFNLIPYVPIDNFQEELLKNISDLLPHNAYQATKSTIEDIILHQRGGLLSIGFLFALYFSTNGIDSMIDAFNRTYHSMESRTWWQQRAISLFLTLTLAFLFIIATALIIFSEAGLNYLIELDYIQKDIVYYMIQAGKWIIVLFLLLTAISFLYFFGPSQKKTWRFISPGSLLATFLILLASLGFSFFANNFGQYNKLYGSIGTLIVILLWIYLNSLVLLIGFELNASIKKARKKRAF